MSGYGGALPLVELKIRAMGEIVNHAVMLEADQIAERVKVAVEAAVRGFNFESYVREVCEDSLREFMTDGAGGEAVRDLAASLGETALNKILKGKS